MKVICINLTPACLHIECEHAKPHEGGECLRWTFICGGKRTYCQEMTDEDVKEYKIFSEKYRISTE